ncbi:ATP-binding protein [Pseudobutyrivibrio sp. MD2005]|uniref:ATP-binding protein n=1 Tax=Pseudobutyrivibrio sp. MD2005 TaxID=1410616 RepID=UPI000487900A|nr:ATP-binding protein [Pseudobutyrivibrio sp. MD2005]
MDKLEVEAKLDNLYTVLDFVEEKLKAIGFPEENVTKLCIVIEEIFVNIANYAYKEKAGMVSLEVDSKASAIRFVFMDEGIKYNPLDRPDPDITLSADERQIGGLGIFMMKKTMDIVEYEYKDNKNILTMIKFF